MRSLVGVVSVLVSVALFTALLVVSSWTSSIDVRQITESNEDRSSGGYIGGPTTREVPVFHEDMPEDDGDAGEDEPAPETHSYDQGENILIVGSDQRTGASGEIGAGTADDVDGARSDMNMLVHIPSDKRSATIISLPRDLDVDRPDCVKWDNDQGRYLDGETVSGQDSVKLNSAYAVGGPRCLAKVVSQVATGDPDGLSISRFLAVDFAGFISVVDELGGIEVCVSKPVDDGELGLLIDRPGTRRLNGEAALDFARARKVMGESGSDYDRIVRQQYLMRSALGELVSTGLILKPERLSKVISLVSDHMYGQNMNAKDIRGLALTMGRMDMSAISFHTVPTSGTVAGNEVVDEAAASALFAPITGIGGAEVDDLPPPPEEVGGEGDDLPEMVVARQAEPLIC